MTYDTGIWRLKLARQYLGAGSPGGASRTREVEMSENARAADGSANAASRPTIVAPRSSGTRIHVSHALDGMPELRREVGSETREMPA